VSDDPARIGSGEGTAGEAVQAYAQSYVQLTEVEASPASAAAALEQRDAYGRVPVLVRVRVQPPIRLAWVVVAVALVASGVLVPNLDAFLRLLIILGAGLALVVGILSRIFIRVPIGAVAVVTRSGKPAGVLKEGVHTVLPVIVLSHLVSTRQVAFDVPVASVRSADGVGVSVDTLLTLVVTDAERLVHTIAMSDLDQLVHAACQDAVRTLIRGTDALATLDLGTEDADRLRGIIDERLEPFGIDVPSVAFTSVTLPAELTASLESRRLASVKLAEQAEQTALDQRRITDQARLEVEEQAGRRAAVEKEAEVEELRLARLEARLAAYPVAARYDMDLARLRVAEQAAANTRAIVSLGGPDLGGTLLLAAEAAPDPAPTAAVPAPEPATTARGERARARRPAP
jgi:regulator of protease activity HflC (stomatin/prohibitin superfamily)